MDYHKSFQLGLKILGYIGLDPTKRTKKAIVISGTGLVWIVVLTVWIMVGFFDQKLTLQIFAKQSQAVGSILFVSLFLIKY